jgi:uncharacterized protein YjeT (DUF2065 family)
MNVPSQSQINAGLRYAGGYVVTAGAVVVAFGALPADKAHAIVDAAQKVLTDIQQTVGDSYALAYLVLPIIAGVIAKFGWNSAKPDNQKQAVVANQPNTIVVQTNSPEAAKQAANAVAAIPEVEKVVTTQAVADATTSDKIVSK